MHFRLNIKLSFLITLVFTTLNAQITNLLDVRNINSYVNPIEHELNSQLSLEKPFGFVNPQSKYNFLLKDISTKFVQLDSLFIIKPASLQKDKTSLDTTKQIFSYSSFGNSYTRTTKTWDGKKWNNGYKVTCTYNINLTLYKVLSEKWIDIHWVGNSRQTYTDYMNKKKYSYIEERYDGTSWHNYRRITSLYNSSGYEILAHSEEWINGSWASTYKMMVEYDQNNNRVKDIRESWEKGNLESTTTAITTFTPFNKTATFYYEIIQNGSRSHAEKYFNSFDNAGNIISTEYQIWENNLWKNYLLTTRNYYPDGKEKMVLTKTWTRNEWTNSHSAFYIYDERGNEIKSTYTFWEGNIIKDILRNSFTYNAKNQVLTWLKESLINNTPQNLYRFEYKYNEYGNETSYIDEKWIDKEWIGISRRFSTYDKDGNLVDAIAEKWNNGWQPGNHFFSYPDIDGKFRFALDYYKLSAHYTEKEPLDYNNPTKIELYQNYPNPFNSITRIHFSIPTNVFVKLSVYNILGQEITSLINKELSKGTHTVDFNASNLASGVYFYRLVINNYFQTKKMILFK